MGLRGVEATVLQRDRDQSERGPMSSIAKAPSSVPSNLTGLPTTTCAVQPVWQCPIASNTRKGRDAARPCARHGFAITPSATSRPAEQHIFCVDTHSLISRRKETLFYPLSKRNVVEKKKTHSHRPTCAGPLAKVSYGPIRGVRPMSRGNCVTGLI